MINFIQRNVVAVGIGSVVALGGIIWLAIGFFGVHTLFIDDTVSEASPFELASSASADAPVVADVIADDAMVDDGAAAESGSGDAIVEPTTADNATTEDAMVAEPGADDQMAESEAVVEPTAVPVEPTAVPEPQVVNSARGSIVNHDHQGQGTVNVLSDGVQTFVRFEDDFSIDNGPDLNVYLVRGAEADGDPSLFDDDFIDLGDLKGNVGSQNYEVPAGTDLTEYDTLVIWCVRFGVAFNAAALDAI